MAASRGERLNLQVLKEAQQEARALDRELREVVAEIVVQLHYDPYLGEELRERANLRVLKDCRKVRFDKPNWRGKPRYRLVYRNEPDDGAPYDVVVLAIAKRENLTAYRHAASRLAKRLRTTRHD